MGIYEQQTLMGAIKKAIFGSSDETETSGNQTSSPTETPSSDSSDVDLNFSSDSKGVISPLCNSSNKWKVVSPFGPRNYKGYKNHPAVDLGVSYEKVVAPFAGTITGTYGAGDCGGMIIIKNEEEKLEAKFCHMSKIDKKSGKVKQGEVVGISGGDLKDPVSLRGNSDGAHLHFELKKNGAFIDPDKTVNKNFCPKN